MESDDNKSGSESEPEIDEKTRLERRAAYKQLRKAREEQALLERSLKAMYRDHPDMESLKLYANTDQESNYFPIYNIDYLPKFRHLKSFSIQIGGDAPLEWDENQKLKQRSLIRHINQWITAISKSKTIMSLRFGTWENLDDMDELPVQKFAKMKSLISLSLPISIDDYRLVQILQSKTIREINELHKSWMSDDLNDRLLKAILKNDTIESLSFDPDQESVISGPQWRQAIQHMDANHAKREQLIKIMPLLMGLQLGGTFRNAILDLAPMIYDYAGIQSKPTSEEIQSMAQQIEPYGESKEPTRKRKLKPPTNLPYMFTEAVTIPPIPTSPMPISQILQPSLMELG